MIRSSIFRLAAASALSFLAIAVICGPGLAQALPYGYMGLYADEVRSSNTASFAGAYTEFAMYVFCAPTDRGIAAAEFSLAYPANVLPADVTTNPLISVSLGNIDTGISVAFADCQSDWVWTHRQRLFLMSTDATRIEIEKNAAVNEYQIATCEPGNPLEPIFISSLLCLNADCPPDTTRPLLTGASNTAGSTIVVSFSEPVLKRSVQDPASYEIAEFDDSTATVPVGEASLLSDGASAVLYTSQPLATGGRKYIVHAAGVYDSWGNAVPSSSATAFVTVDRDPPRLASASATVDSLLTVVFNEAVSPATAANPDNYRIYNNGVLVTCFPYRATLVADNRVVLSFGSTCLIPTLVTLLLRVTSVTDLAGNIISSSYNTALFTAPDMSPPYIAAIQALANRLVRVMFNEPVLQATAETAGNYDIYRKADTLMADPLPVSAAALQPDKRYVHLTLGADLEMESPYVLHAHDIEDLHGNRMTLPNIKEFSWPDTYPPVPLSANALARDLIGITFNERLNETTAETASNYSVYETSNGSGNIAVTGVEMEASADAVRISLGWQMKLDVSYTILIQRVKDLKGNAIVRATITTICPDAFPPVLTGVAPLSARSIRLAFDEKLAAAPAVNTADYALFETEAPSHVVAISSATLSGDGTSVRLDLGADLVIGKSYTIAVSNLTDLKGNVIAPGTSLVFVYADSIPPTLLSASAPTNTAVLASFSEKLESVGAENPGNYLVFETADPTATIPIAAAALSGDSSKVLLSLGTALTGSIAYSLRATGAADRAGNPLPAGSVVAITGPDTAPPHLSMAEAVTLAYVRVVFDEPVTAATAGAAANYVLIPAAHPDSPFSPASVDLPDSRTAGLRLSANLVSGAIYAVRVSNVADPAGNVIAPGSEKIFVCPTIPTGYGHIGLYVDAYHTGFEVRGDFWTPFTTYVWYLAGSAGLMAAEFSIDLPENVILAGYALNPLIPVSLGDPLNDLSVAFSQCQSGWVWTMAGECYLMNHNESVINVGSDPILADCSEGYPIEPAVVISRILCNPIYIGTLLQEFAASYGGGAVEVTWRLSRMDDGVRFRVLRREEGAAAYGTPSDDVEANGLSFAYRDETAGPGGAYRYRVEYVDGSGGHTLFETDPVAIPALPLALGQNWPNPFNPSTTISYHLPEAVRVRLEIFDVAGHRIVCLVDGNEERGTHSAVWNGAAEAGRPAAPGIYIYRLTAGRETLSRKMVLVR